MCATVVMYQPQNHEEQEAEVVVRADGSVFPDDVILNEEEEAGLPYTLPRRGEIWRYEAS